MEPTENASFLKKGRVREFVSPAEYAQGLLYAWDPGDLLAEDHLPGQLCAPVGVDRRADEVLIDAGGGVEEALAFIFQGGFEVQLLHRALDGRPADTRAVNLPQIESLGEIVLEDLLSENAEPRQEALIAFGVGVTDGFLRAAGRGVNAAAGIRGLNDLARGAAEVDQSAIVCIQPGFDRRHARQAHRSVEGVPVLRGLNHSGARGQRAVPAGPRAGMAGDLPAESAFVDDVLDVLDGYWRN